MLAASTSLFNIPVVILDVGFEVPAKYILALSTTNLAHMTAHSGTTIQSKFW
jgi:hypothetical protein